MGFCEVLTLTEILAMGETEAGCYNFHSNSLYCCANKFASIVKRFLCSPVIARVVEILQRQHLCHYGDTICHPMLGYVTTKLHGTSTAGATTMLYFQTELFSSFLPSPHAGHVNLVAAKHWLFMSK